MGQWGPTLTAGEGHAAFDASEHVERMRLRILEINPKQTRLVGNQQPRGVWHLGEAGLGAFPDDPTAQDPPYQSFARFLHSEFDEWWIPATQTNLYSASSVWWRWLGGVQVEVTVFW